MFLKSEHLSFPSSYFLILDSSVQKYFGESGGESRPGRSSRSAPGRAPLSPKLPQPSPANSSVISAGRLGFPER